MQRSIRRSPWWNNLLSAPAPYRVWPSARRRNVSSRENREMGQSRCRRLFVDLLRWRFPAVCEDEEDVVAARIDICCAEYFSQGCFDSGRVRFAISFSAQRDSSVLAKDQESSPTSLPGVKSEKWGRSAICPLGRSRGSILDSIS